MAKVDPQLSTAAAIPADFGLGGPWEISTASGGSFGIHRRVGEVSLLFRGPHDACVFRCCEQLNRFAEISAALSWGRSAQKNLCTVRNSRGIRVAMRITLKT